MVFDANLLIAIGLPDKEFKNQLVIDKKTFGSFTSLWPRTVHRFYRL